MTKRYNVYLHTDTCYTLRVWLAVRCTTLCSVQLSHAQTHPWQLQTHTAHTYSYCDENRCIYDGTRYYYFFIVFLFFYSPAWPSSSHSRRSQSGRCTDTKKKKYEKRKTPSLLYSRCRKQNGRIRSPHHHQHQVIFLTKQQRREEKRTRNRMAKNAKEMCKDSHSHYIGCQSLHFACAACTAQSTHTQQQTSTFFAINTIQCLRMHLHFETSSFTDSTIDNENGLRDCLCVRKRKRDAMRPRQRFSHFRLTLCSWIFIYRSWSHWIKWLTKCARDKHFRKKNHFYFISATALIMWG